MAFMLNTRHIVNHTKCWLRNLAAPAANNRFLVFPSTSSSASPSAQPYTGSRKFSHYPINDKFFSLTEEQTQVHSISSVVIFITVFYHYVIELFKSHFKLKVFRSSPLFVNCCLYVLLQLLFVMLM